MLRGSQQHSLTGSHLTLRKSVSREEMELLNHKCNSILTPEKGELDESAAFFKLQRWQTSAKLERYDSKFSEAQAEKNGRKNQLLRELEHSTHKRKIKRTLRMSGQSEISYLDQYKQFQPTLSSIKNTIDTERSEMPERPANSSRLSQYPQLERHPKLSYYLNNKIQSPVTIPRDDPVREVEAIEEFCIPCKLIPIRPRASCAENKSTLKVHEIIEARYNGRYLKRGQSKGPSDRSRTKSIDYQSLIKQQSSILVNNSSLSRENKFKLGESLDRILRLVSDKRTRQSSSCLQKYKMTDSIPIKFPSVEGLVKKKRK